ncbi:MAG TPA: type IIL restriction-modification enzyme MmeI [Brevundimonas sp.]
MTPEAFVYRWSGREGGAERANYVLFLTELTQTLDLPTPEPADSQSGYRFEFPVDGDFGQPLRIDLYKRDAFILEAKQSRWAVNQQKPKNEAIVQPDMFGHAPPPRRGRRARWDADMGAAFRQARDYSNRLPPDHERPPFLITCDVGRSFEF